MLGSKFIAAYVAAEVTASMDPAIGIRRKGPPPAVVIALTPEERAALEHLCRAGTTERRLVDRAHVVRSRGHSPGRRCISGTVKSSGHIRSLAWRSPVELQLTAGAGRHARNAGETT